jgi:two-component system LytT family sensor kinase
MEMNSDHRRVQMRRAAAAVSLVTIPALLSTLETVMFARLGGHPIAAWRAFMSEAPQWYTWLPLVPAIVRLGDRYPLRWPLRARAVVVHVVTCLTASAIVAVADTTVNQWARPSAGGFATNFRNWFVGGLPGTTLVYLAIIAVSYAVTNGARLRERERSATLLQTELRQAQLSSLQMQLQPHFLFNSLNAIMALVRDHDTTGAVRAISLLSDVLRTTAVSGDAHETTLEHELTFVTRYLEIERVRFGERLRVVIDVAPDLADALVPTFVLQPFVENALKHGILRERTGNLIALGARPMNGSLILTVRDDGCGLQRPGSVHAGVGIANARARLAHLYGEAGRLSVQSVSEGAGVIVEIVLPLRRART